MRWLVNNRLPFVIRNANKDIYKTHDFIRKHGNEPVVFVTKEKRHYHDLLRTVYNTKDYVANCNTILDANPNLLPNTLQFDALGDDITFIKSAQMFISIKRGNGTEMHAAWASNFFYQIDGEKEWTFVHPNNSHFLYPVQSSNGIYSASYASTFNLKDKQQEFDLLRYCPRYTAILKPGDILFNPEMWWHGVKNITDASIGIATRWTHKVPAFKSSLWIAMLGNPELNKILLANVEKYGDMGLYNMDEHTVINGKTVRVSAIETMNTGREISNGAPFIYGMLT